MSAIHVSVCVLLLSPQAEFDSSNVGLTDSDKHIQETEPNPLPANQPTKQPPSFAWLKKDAWGDSQGESDGLHPLLSLVLGLGKEGEGHLLVVFHHDKGVVPLHTGETQILISPRCVGRKKGEEF